MTALIEPPPPPPRRMGCLGKGCLILSFFILFLLIAGAIGIYFGMKRYSAVGHSLYWAQNAHMLAREPSPVPRFETTEQKMQAAERKWNNFETAARQDEPAQIELTADDLNNLIANNRHARGKAFVSIENNRLRIQTSVPLGARLGRNGYYLNGDIVIQTDGPRSLDRLPLNSVTVNGQAAPTDLPGWKYQSRSLDEYAADYRQSYGVNSFEIRGGKVILSKSRP